MIEKFHNNWKRNNDMTPCACNTFDIVGRTYIERGNERRHIHNVLKSITNAVLWNDFSHVNGCTKCPLSIETLNVAATAAAVRILILE